MRTRTGIRIALAAIIFALFAGGAHAATGTIAPSLPPQFFDNNGDPAASHKIFTYLAGTSTKANTYTDVGLTSANTNPIVLDSAGRCTIFLTPGVSYKFVLTTSGDTDPPTSPIWTRDNVNAVPASAFDVDISGTAGEALTTNDVVYLSLGDGGNTAGRWYKTDADNTYSSTTATALGVILSDVTAGNSGSIRINGRATGLSGLSTGTVYYASATAGALTSSAPTNARRIGVSDSTTSLILSHWLPIPDATGSIAGLVGLSAQTLGAGVKHFSDHPTFEAGTSTGTNALVNGTICADTGPRANSGAGETDLSTCSVPANTLDTNSKAIRITSFGTAANSAGAKIIRHYFGATSLHSTVLTFTASTASQRWYAVSVVMRRDATNQRAISSFVLDEGGVGGTRAINTSPAETLSGAVTAKSTGAAAGGAANDIVQEGFFVEIIG